MLHVVHICQKTKSQIYRNVPNQSGLFFRHLHLKPVLSNVPGIRRCIPDITDTIISESYM